MALQQSVTLESGLSAQNAYLRAELVKLQSKTSMAFDLAFYVNDEASTAFERKAYWCGYDLHGENPIKQAYLFLKTLPEFQGAQDV